MFKRIGRSQPPALPGGRETIYLQPARRSRFWARLALVLILGVPFVGFFSLLVSQVTTGEFAETRAVDTTAVALATPDVAAFVANDSRVLDAQAEAEATRIALVAQRNEAETALAEFDQKLEQADQQQREALLRERQRIENGHAQLQLDIQANDEDLRLLRERLDAENRARAEEIRLAAEAETKRIQAIRDEAVAMEEMMRIKQQTMWTNAAEVMTSALAWISVAFAVIIGLIVAVSSGIVMVAWVQIQLENRRIVAAHRNALPSPPQHAPRREPPRREPSRYEDEESTPPPHALDYATVEELMREWQAATLRRRPASPTPRYREESEPLEPPAVPEVEPPRTVQEPFSEPPRTDQEPFLEPRQNGSEIEAPAEQLDRTREPTAREKALIVEWYHRLGGSKSAVCRALYGMKNAQTWQYVTEAIEAAETAEE